MGSSHMFQWCSPRGGESGKLGSDGAPSPVNPGDSATRQEVPLGGPPIRPGGEDITWPDQVTPRARKASSTRKIKPQTSNLNGALHFMLSIYLKLTGTRVHFFEFHQELCQEFPIS